MANAPGPMANAPTSMQEGKHPVSNATVLNMACATLQKMTFQKDSKTDFKK